ncbi:hypothetical protein HU200_051135 [Digitaria exilis]|uniref:Uncharacterized protein n=1 Tax=Digitaria exilis TaxID=1010633 RepID=A0A835E5E4_9POAL|nr:hypothetical protein HU200_051135 [Digitaria exilis]
MSHAGMETFLERQQWVKLRLPKEERVKTAKQRIQDARMKKSTGDRSTGQGTSPVKEGENAATPSASEVRVLPLKEEEDAATMSASEGDEGVAPAPSIEIVVSP